MLAEISGPCSDIIEGPCYLLVNLLPGLLECLIAIKPIDAPKYRQRSACCSTSDPSVHAVAASFALRLHCYPDAAQALSFCRCSTFFDADQTHIAPDDFSVGFYFAPVASPVVSVLLIRGDRNKLPPNASTCDRQIELTLLKR